uniref:Uveal autoantigen with coiled-coil domains and ankyrin repeats n=1 Tax=Lepisosteus oculatus TaxID=7918 RepID=W5N9I0_LEPOC|nr:PREDICTED: uveal autoantigen with coiled-coil domains and ankyrin repeats isoform X2 [Lepisosteus oculatus]
MSRWLACTSAYLNTDWNKYDDRLMKAVERGEADKVSSALGKKGIVPTKLDVEGRSAFHLAASKGYLDCLNLLLGHSLDITAADATGKNALHLAARNGHSLCVQKLLQHNCPVENVDLQGRTALHDAVMAGCSSSVKLLCDSGASVNAKDFDGRTPLVLATQMCHPSICQLLLERGADIGIRDKQNKTALILGCEYACKDAVEVLLKRGADVTAGDVFGHDSYHYARLSKDAELVTLVKEALDKVVRAKEAAKIEQMFHQSVEHMTVEAEVNVRDQIIQGLEKEKKDLKDTLRKFQQDQKTLLEKVSGLQQQLEQEKKTVEDLWKEREQLKLVAKGKEKEENVKAVETVKVQLWKNVGDYSGQSVIKGKDPKLVKQSHSFDSAQILQPSSPTRSVSRPLELSLPGPAFSSESEALRKDIEVLRKRHDAAAEENARLQSQLASKSLECRELAESCEATRRDSDRQVREMEEALSDVQKRMVDSEAKVKQLQAHVVAVREHLSSQMVEELRGQLQEVKGKYEGASAEVGRVRNHLKQSEKALEEYKQSEGRLAEDVERLTRELSKLRKEREEAAVRLMDAEGRMKEMEARLASAVPAERFDNMKNLLTNAVDEKEKQASELREDYERVLEEATELQRELEVHRAEAARRVPREEHERLKAAQEEQTASLERKLSEVTAKSQTLIKEIKKSQQVNEQLREQVQDLNSKIQAEYVPLKSHEEVKRSLDCTVEELSNSLAGAERKIKQTEAQMQTLQTEKDTVCEKITHLQARYVPPEKFEEEVSMLSSLNKNLTQELEEFRRKYQEKEQQLEKMMSENVSMKRRVQEEFVPKGMYEESKSKLGSELEKANGEISRLVKECKDAQEELKQVKEGNVMLTEKLQVIQTQLEKEYISLRDHEAIKNSLKSTVSELECKNKEAACIYQSAQEETLRLHKELEEQKKELDTIQEAIHSKFVPISVIEEKEKTFNATVKDMKKHLAELQERYSQAKMEGEHSKHENEKLKVEMVSVQQNVETCYVTSEKCQEIELAYKEKLQGLTHQLRDFEQQYKDVTLQKKELEEQNAQCNLEIQKLQRQMETDFILVERFEAMQQSVNSRIRQAEEECARAKEAHRQELEKVAMLERELRSQRANAMLLTEHVQVKEALEREVTELKRALEEEEKKNSEHTEEIASLQVRLLNTAKAVEDFRAEGSEELLGLQSEKRRLEAEVVSLGHRLSGLAEKYEELSREAARAQEAESNARTENQRLQERGHSIETEIKELKERYDKSLSTIGDLQKRIQTSSEQTEAKDKKITELLNDAERLKQALNSLAMRPYTANMPTKRQTQQVDTLQAQIKSLQQQLADAERRHREVVSIYRTHLLSAAQGHMDEDVQAALLQIIRMRQEFVC